MPTIVTKRVLNPTVTLLEVSCPPIARKAKPGQFVMVRPDPTGERIPLTIADYDAVRGTVTIMYQTVGLTTQKLDQLSAGEDILDMVGPLGNPTEVDGVKRAVVIGGGVGCAIAFPQAKALYRAGAHGGKHRGGVSGLRRLQPADALPEQRPGAAGGDAVHRRAGAQRAGL